MTSLFWVTIDSIGLSVLKPFSSWVRKVLGVARAHMSLDSLQGVAASAALAACVSLVTILQQVIGPEFYSS